MSENITLLCVIVLRLSIICYTTLFSETSGICGYHSETVKYWILSSKVTIYLVTCAVWLETIMVSGHSLMSLLMEWPKYAMLFSNYWWTILTANIRDCLQAISLIEIEKSN